VLNEIRFKTVMQELFGTESPRKVAPLIPLGLWLNNVRIDKFSRSKFHALPQRLKTHKIEFCADTDIIPDKNREVFSGVSAMFLLLFCFRISHLAHPCRPPTRVKFCSLHKLLGKTLPQMTILTPSFAPDFELCADLNRSVLDFFPGTVEHHIVVPRNDMQVFRPLSNQRTHIRCEAECLPASFVRVPFGKLTVNLTHPFPPIRGWILQQLIKLAVAAESTDDVIILVDSDIEFLRPTGVEAFARDGIVRFYRLPKAIDAQLPRHETWHRVARNLLGLEQIALPFTDYISSLMAWNPGIVRQMLARVSSIAGTHWTSAIARQLHFSEWTLYGLYVDELADEEIKCFASSETLCLSYWDENPLSDAGIAEFASAVRPNDVAAMISAKSRTPPDVRRKAFAACRRNSMADNTP